MARLLGYALLMGVLTLSPIEAPAQDKERWEDSDFMGYMYEDSRNACMDGDGIPETAVEEFRNLKGDNVRRYCTRIHKDGGGYAWAFEKDGVYFVDKECKGIFKKLGSGEKLAPPECAKKR